MAIYTPETAKQVEDRTKVDVQQEAPDSNPYLKVHWLRSLINAVSRRIFDLYRDLRRTEQRLMPDTADAETAPRWGGIYVGPSNAASFAVGPLVATGTSGAVIPAGTGMSAGAVEYESTAAAEVEGKVCPIVSLVRVGSTAIATTDGPHGLTSFVPVSIGGATEIEYSVTDAEIMVTGEDTFTYAVPGTPTTPATGSPIAVAFVALVPVVSVSPGAAANLTLDTPVALSSAVAGIDNTLHATYAGVSGGADAETLPAYKARYLEKIRVPVAHYNVADITAKAKEVTGVTRVFVRRAGDPVSTVAVSALTRVDQVAKCVTSGPHLLHDGQFTTITGAGQLEYNVTYARVIVEDDVTFHYVVPGTPTTPATGSIQAAQSVPLGQSITYFMRDNDPDPIPSPSAVATTKAKIEEILPANTATGDCIVEAPVAAPVAFLFSELTPDSPSLRTAVAANLGQFFEEQTSVGVVVDEDAYRAAVANTVDPSTGTAVTSFALVSPTGDIAPATNAIPTLGGVSYT